MERKNFAQVLKDAKFDIKREYQRLYTMFYSKDTRSKNSFRDVCAYNFWKLPFKGTCLSLNDFDDSHGFDYKHQPIEPDVEYLVSFCEYIINIANYNCFNQWDIPEYEGYDGNDLIRQINSVIESMGYMRAEQDDFIIFVPKSQPAIVVSEMLPPELSYKVIEYNHYSMKGDLARKQAILKLLADQLEAKEKELYKLNPTLKDDLFYLLNTINIRHNNIETTSRNFKQGVADMTEEELEEWYDRTYDICLYAFMTLDQTDRNAKVKELKRKIEASKE